MWHRKHQEQGIVESVFAVGVLALLIGGVVTLVILGISNRQKSFDRRKASELATLVTEELVANSKTKPEEFWQLSPIPATSRSGFEGYTYSVTFTNISDSAENPGCSLPGVIKCAEAVIGIGWSGKTNQNLTFTRFFSKQ